MADFTSSFWGWFILVAVVVSFIGIFALIIWMSLGKRPANDKIKTMGHVWDGTLEELNNPLPMWWLYLFYITLFFGGIYLLLYPGVGAIQGILKWTQTGQYEQEIHTAEATFGPLYEQYRNEDIKKLATNSDASKIGQRLFMTYCTACHGSDARGGPGYPNLRDGDWLYGDKPENIKLSILNGRHGMMPGWSAVVGAGGILELAEYIMQLGGRTVNEENARRGKEKFAQFCVACHGKDATGNPLMGAPNLTDNTWLYGGSQRAIMQSIADGRQGRMPAHGEFLGEAKVHLLSAYIYGISHYQDAK